MTREEIAQKVAKELGWTIWPNGKVSSDGYAIPKRVWEALVDAKVRLQQTEQALRDLVEHADYQRGTTWEINTRWIENAELTLEGK